MKSIKIFFVLLCILPSLTSCDYIRRSLGKPTSEDINRIRLEQVVLEQARADSIARVQAVADSIKAAEAQSLTMRYYIVVGSFKVDGNAQSLAEKLQVQGYDAMIMDFFKGMKSVAISGSNDKDAIDQELSRLKSDPDFKYDTVIFDTESGKVIY